jgi:hypothetical protein
VRQTSTSFAWIEQNLPVHTYLAAGERDIFRKFVAFASLSCRQVRAWERIGIRI